MRSELFRIPFAGSISIGGWEIPVFGFGLILAIWTLVSAVLLWRRIRAGQTQSMAGSIITWALVSAVIVSIPSLVGRLLPREWPVFGFGLMLFLGFFAAAQLAAWRFRRRGLDPEIPWDIAFWGVPAGVIGARLFHIIQYWNESYSVQPFPKVFMLWDGGLVFYGGLVTGLLAFYFYCRSRALDPLDVGDLIVPSLFVGMGFGRLGCFLNGCCYGDFCTLPWAVAFPQGSHPYRTQVSDGYLTGTEPWSLLLHPTQLYSALDAFILMGLTLAYYPARQRRGDVMALGLACHAVTRFLIEFVRNDEPGQFGTSLTISQWISGVLLISAIAFWSWLRLPASAPARGQAVH